MTSVPSGTISPRLLRALKFRMSSGCAAKGRVGLRGDVIGAAKEIEIVDVKRAEIDLKRVKDIGQRHAHGFGLEPVHVQVKLRRARRGRWDRRPASAGRLRRLGHQLIGGGLQRLQARPRRGPAIPF